ncbi:cation diffusion facilitator family transporter [Marinitoga sp. 38H-ov]|uniref:cation diffusion facilitator family transporter n=1 Tax=Marinitoga sp. 38H-ov TaxID=1755814 RepID=UPI0013EA68ED|nr:cation diffusion facilitator family transporter [Marinitoga sp. 38H-ov]KAF2956556.1 cation transporter [Marinitoga sp. 38H-ov]
MSGHHHHHENDLTEKKLFFSVVSNLIISLSEIIGGMISNSLALISDSLHNLNDTFALVLSYVARKISKKPKDTIRTYGYKRVEILAAFINTVFLLAVAIFLIVEGIKKFYNPEVIDGKLMLIISIIGLLGNLITAFLLFKESKDNLNIKATFVHIASDTLSSVLIIFGAIFIYKYNWYILDPLFTLFISGYIIYESYSLLKESVNILIQGIPNDIDLDGIKREVEKLNFVDDVHHIHVWTTDGKDKYLECHVSLNENDNYDLDDYLKRINSLLHEKFDISHTTIQFEKNICKGGK